MKSSPVDGWIANASGWFTIALAAGPPLPLNPAVPVPATVWMFPLAASTRRTRLPISPMKRLPAGSRASAMGPASRAWVAGPPSPIGGGEAPA